jgi:hypothetical protein
MRAAKIVWRDINGSDHEPSRAEGRDTFRDIRRQGPGLVKTLSSYSKFRDLPEPGRGPEPPLGFVVLRSIAAAAKVLEILRAVGRMMGLRSAIGFL